MSGAARLSTTFGFQGLPQNSLNQRPTMALFSCSLDLMRIPFVERCSQAGIRIRRGDGWGAPPKDLVEREACDGQRRRRHRPDLPRKRPMTLKGEVHRQTDCLAAGFVVKPSC